MASRVSKSQPAPEECLGAARIIMAHFSYVFAQFLPIYKPEVRDERHARLLALAMRLFDGRHLLGWRSFRLGRSDGQVAIVGVVSWEGSETDHFLTTVLAFSMAVARMAPLQLMSCLIKAYRVRALLSPPQSPVRDMVILYFAAEASKQRRGYGERLLKALEDEAVDRQLLGLVAAVRRHNATARAFFQHNGFVEESRSESEDADLLRYRKPIDEDVSRVGSAPSIGASEDGA